MSLTLVQGRLPDMDEPWRRLPWILPLSILIWLGAIVGFSLLLQEVESKPIEFKPIEARIVEMPPEVGGLQGGGGEVATPKPPAPAEIKPQPPPPVVKPVPKPVIKEHKKVIAPPRFVSPYGTMKSKEEESPAAEPPSGGASAGREGFVGEGGAGSGSGGGGGSGGLGNSNVGARAMYAPKPTIPDELREDVFQAEAVARFRVSYDGSINVELVTPTSNAQINEILLSTLRQWRFTPAVKGGVAIDSVFELRIPVSVQ